ncbi:MAG: DNA primase [Ignavibacteriae bacterium HGW-Ignavibacteriae-2]|jgi:DNA primase|nr:MAG: DNA primase [Ignavibacteriae bacterium HGW-Ignavibacteriae-2]
MRIPENQIEEIRSSANILDIVSGYVQLRKRGRNFIGSCPFHNEKTPSFTVSEEKQIFHCFGCGAGGNVYKFLMDFKNISFVEAVQEVADQIGVKINFEQDKFSSEQNELEKYYEINVLAAKFFSNKLLNSDDGEEGREYFKNRKIKPQTQRAFGLGYASALWENLLFYLNENRVDLNDTYHLGLIDKRDDGSYYDKFRGRIIFPIFSPNGRVIAFGGRILDNSAKAAKYLNSPESSIYSKRRSLYGLFQSKDEIRKLNKVILVEGYMDLISLYQHGVKNVVASSGTSLTEEQVQLLSRFTRNITVLFDADEAGQKAAMRSIEILLKQDFDVKIVLLPENEDPDSYINKFGRESFDDKLDRAQNFLEFQMDQYKKAGSLEDPVRQAEAIRSLVGSAALVSDTLKRNLLIKSISKKFNLREKLIETELEKHLNQIEAKEARISQNAPTTSSTPIPKTHLTKEKNGNGLSAFEKEIIRLFFEGNEEVIGIICDHIEPEDFLNETFQEIAGIVRDSYLQHIISPAALIQKINDDEVKNFILSISLSQEAISKKWAERNHDGTMEFNIIKYTEDVIKKYRLLKIDSVIKINNQRLASLDNEEEMIEILKENQELQEEKKIIQESNGTSYIE